ncbi:MAG: lysophospholipid acyltransferase family protein [Candidatus Dormibacteraceae bacterium]
MILPADGERYLGPEYLAALARGPIEPLLHRDPERPPRLYRVVTWLAARLLPILFRFRVQGLENLPPPPYLLAANHQAWFDALFLLAALPSRPMIYTMGRRETVFDRAWKRWLLRRMGVFPISPQMGELDATGLVSVYQLLGLGAVVLIFPEGRYSVGRALQPLKRGVAHFSLQSGVPIVPVALSGLDRWRLRGVIEVSIAPPLSPDPPRWWSLNQRVSELVETVRESILGAFGRRRGATAGGGGLLESIRARVPGRRRRP